MKFRVCNLALVLSISVTSLCGATGVQIPLSGLHGGYEITPTVPPDFGFPTVRVATFAIPNDIESINDMTLVISGEWHEGELSCSSWDGSVETSPLPGSLWVSIWLQYGYPSRYFDASIIVPSGEFSELSAHFESCCPPGSVDYNELIGGEHEAELSVDIMYILPCWLSLDSYGTLTEVRIDLDVGVSTERSTWSSIKALY
jgi:hypothetical protein